VRDDFIGLAPEIVQKRELKPADEIGYQADNRLNSVHRIDLCDTGMKSERLRQQPSLPGLSTAIGGPSWQFRSIGLKRNFDPGLSMKTHGHKTEVAGIAQPEQI
jgi:hypothetical protein